MTESNVWVKTSLVAKALGKTIEHEWGWIQAQVLSGDVSGLSQSDASIKLKVEDSAVVGEGGAAVNVEVEAAHLKGSLHMANEEILKDKLPPDDLITLNHLHEPAVVHCLKKRYEKDIIYTSTGPILIALNPFKSIPGLYGDEMMGKYWERGEKVSDGSELKPHVFATADAAFRQMMQAIMFNDPSAEASSNKKNQSVLVSGESGAGKTVTAKHIMKYLATLSQRKAEHAKRRRGPSPGRGDNKTAPPRRMTRGTSRRLSRAQSWKAGALIEEKILQSNPILESFGNARTKRNDNSSRFGKYIELQFKATGSLIGAKIDTYLLEKVRLIHQHAGERNFHIFYEMLAAASEDERKMFHLGDYTAQDFKMTSASGTFDRRDGADDAELFDDLVVAMGTMGMDPSTQEDIFAICVAFLHASNLTFEAVTDDSSKIDASNPHLAPVLKLLGLQQDAFSSAMCEYEIGVGSTSYARQLDKEQAAKSLEALVKAAYGSMFSFIVQNINKQIDYKPKKGAPALAKAAFIGVLDIFGFEYFEENSLEQLCINYCNEALQQQFNLHVFKTEQAEYEKEGIEWDFIEFPDNQDVIELINRPGRTPGIIQVLTDQCRTPRATDSLFADAMYKACGDHPRFEANNLQRARKQFVIKHYAGPVVYDIEGFLEKNKDEIPRGAAALLEGSSNQFVQLLGKINAASPAPSGPGGKAKSNARPTVGKQFAAQLAELRNKIEETDPHYVRCIKPNQHLGANDFNNHIVAEQLSYCGVLEAIRVSRVGYSQRYSHDDFNERYHFLADADVPPEVSGLNEYMAKAQVMKIDVVVKSCAKAIWMQENPGKTLPSKLNSAVGIQKGETKVFLRQKAFDYVESFRVKKLGESATKIEALVRGFLERRRYKRVMFFVIKTQACARRFIARNNLVESRMRKSATKIQTTYRMYIARSVFLKQRAVAIWCQKVYRGCMGRMRFKSLDDKRQSDRLKNNLEYKAAAQIQNLYRAQVAREAYKVLRQQKENDAPDLSPEEEALLRKAEVQHAKSNIAAAKAAAVATEKGLSKDKEVEALRKELAVATKAAAEAEEVKAQLLDMEIELERVQTQLERLKVKEGKTNTRLAEVESENAKLKEQVKSGGGPANGGYVSTRYGDEHNDLKNLDERLHGVTFKAQQGKNDLQALVQSLAILRN